MRPDLDTWALDMADLVARRSRDPSTQVGAVILRPDKTVASVGYNGFPRGCSDDDSLYANRETKYARVVHAETNAIVTAKERLDGCTLYTSPLPPCPACAGLIIQAGIKRIVSRVRLTQARAGWLEAYGTSKTMFCEAGVHTEIVREEG
jgi:dCMP deaminase